MFVAHFHAIETTIYEFIAWLMPFQINNELLHFRRLGLGLGAMARSSLFFATIQKNGSQCQLGTYQLPNS